MRRTILLLAVLALTLAVAPAGAEEEAETPEPCADAAREHLNADGWELEFAPPLPVSDLGAVRDATDDALTSYRNAIFYFVAQFPEAGSANVDFLLEWGEDTSDFDLHVYDDEGWPLAMSQDENLGGDPVERLSLRLDHCERFQVVVRNWAGDPDETLNLTITPDTGDVEEEVPEDERLFLYLAGDRPGQTSMAWGHPNDLDVPTRSAFSEDRPATGLPNSYTRPAVGFNQYRNSLQAHFTEFQMERDVVGDASALVWVSSRTMADHDGTLYLQLWLDGVKAGELEVPGSEISAHPTPIIAEFEDLDVPDVWDVTLQVAAEPVADSNGNTSELGNAEYTVLYDSVQFPSRLVLP